MRPTLGGMTLHDRTGHRKYLTSSECQQFLRAAEKAPPDVRLFCLVLAATGARLSEALSITPARVDLDAGTLILETLKRRKSRLFRHVPVARPLLRHLDQHFQVRAKQRDRCGADQLMWKWSRTTAWRHVKAVMAAAGISGAFAMPKGLRHTFAVDSLQLDVPLTLVQTWMGHASLRTTSIYLNAVGREERAFAARRWRSLRPFLAWSLLRMLFDYLSLRRLE
jgi:integrase/recombinase XerD